MQADSRTRPTAVAGLFYPSDPDLLRIAMSICFDQTDFSVVVKNRASPSKPWRWEIYRAGRKSPVECSSVLYETVEAYNFIRTHKTLRTTPAMAAGVTSRLWEIGDIVDVLERGRQSKVDHGGAV